MSRIAQIHKALSHLEGKTDESSNEQRQFLNDQLAKIPRATSTYNLDTINEALRRLKDGEHEFTPEQVAEQTAYLTNLKKTEYPDAV